MGRSSDYFSSVISGPKMKKWKALAIDVTNYSFPEDFILLSSVLTALRAELSLT
jgi:hypothetical protein